MNKKEKFLDFVDRYYLDGNIGRAFIELNEQEMFTSAFNTDNHVYCEVRMKENPLDEINTNISVNDTERMKRLLRGFEDPEINVYYNQYNQNDSDPHSLVFKEDNVRSNFLLTRSGVVKPYSKDIPNTLKNSKIDFTLSDDIKEKFNKFNLMLKDETRSFSFFQREGKVHILFGMQRFVGSNNISIKLNIDPNHKFEDEIIFSVDTFNSIVQNNEDCKIKISVIDKAMLVKCISDTFVNKYLIASSKNKQK